MLTELTRQAVTQRRFEAVAESLLEKAVHLPATHTFDQVACEAGERIRKWRKDVTLDGLSIRELIDEDRRWADLFSITLDRYVNSRFCFPASRDGVENELRNILRCFDGFGAPALAQPPS